MAIKRESHAKKAPSQNPTSFYKSEQQGGAHGKATNEPDTMPDKPRKVGDPTMKGAREKNARAKRMEGKLI